MVNPELSILPPKYYSENPPEKVAFAPVGAGGYKFVSYKAGEGLVLKAFDKYRLGKPPVEDVIVKAVPEVATRISELKAGSADLMVGVPADLKASLESTPGVKVDRRAELPPPVRRHQAGPSSGAGRCARPAGDELRRQLRGDRGRAAGRHGQVQHRPGQHALQQPRPQALRLSTRPRPSKLLDEAGWVAGTDGIRVKDGVRLSLDMDTTNGSYLMDKEIAQVMADYWKAGRHRDQGPQGHRLRHQLRSCAPSRAPATAT